MQEIRHDDSEVWSELKNAKPLNRALRRLRTVVEVTDPHKQNKQVSIYPRDKNEIVTLSDGTRYKVTAKGPWIRIKGDS